MIPRRIHFVWIGGALPDWAEHNIHEFAYLNRGFAVEVHDEKSLTPELAGLVMPKMHPSTVADLVRLSVLLQFGGWYFDVDYLPLRPLREAERAWGLDGRHVFVSRQDHREVPLNNCVMACDKGAPGMVELVRAALQVQAPGRTRSRDRCIYGPDLLSAVVARKPGLFTVADWPWFMPLRHAGACDYYQRALRGNIDALRTVEPRTGGQLPFALHLWLNGNGHRVERAFHEAPDDGAYALVEDCESGHSIGGIAEGLIACGFGVRRYNKLDDGILDRLPHKPAVLVSWNNVQRADLAESAARHRVPCLWCENGFFDRKHYMQVDHEGFLHRASWGRRLLEPPPEGAAERLARFYPGGLTPMWPRRGGCILVLGQVPGDTQMAESELTGPVPLQEAVGAALPPGVRAYFRPHPTCKQNPNSCHRLLPELVPGAYEHKDYVKTKSGPGLSEALTHAQFCIAVNSNAMVDALAAGVPSLALGPHLGITAGAIRQATLATLAADIQAMLAGWRPEQAAVQRFMEWLAARQWTREELARPEVLRPLLAAAGVVMPGQAQTERMEAAHAMPGM